MIFIINPQKYLDQLRYERPDAVLGNLMSDLHFSVKLNGIKDACDWSAKTNNRHDRMLIHRRQPMFYNVKAHRTVNRADVLAIIRNLAKNSQ